MTEQDLSNLRWMIRCNDQYKVGYLGPTVKRFGRVPECELLVEAGLAKCNDGLGWTAKNPRLGYFITAEGRAALGHSHS